PALPVSFHSFVTPFGHPPDTLSFNLGYLFFLSQTRPFGYLFDVSLRPLDKKITNCYHERKQSEGGKVYEKDQFIDPVGFRAVWFRGL
ncbi:MAG: hypothetical protein LBG27_04375, partial [Spirochaetaceae bacterium]|nr:hypothetical protein [Spirochaetaceae bacterium]